MEILTAPSPTPTERELTQKMNAAGVPGDVELVTTGIGPRYARVHVWGLGRVISLLGRNRAEARATIADMM